MPLATNQALGPYRIAGKLGEGGMGEVWRAHDARLNRDVAIKALPEAVATDPERIARFEREAQILAALKHPGIAGIHGLEQADGVRYLVLEYVEGESLAQNLARRAMPIEDALAVARQIADALEAAHEKGIIHRDLKPANIMLTPDGTVKVLDFGLGKALAPESSTPAATDAMNSPTLTAATQLGVILGTAAYMSPEQAKGRPADKRSDIWAFGCVLFELLTGTRLFAGDDVSDTMAAVLRADPDWSLLPSTTPPPIVQLLKRCLVKDRRQRLPDISVARFEIDDWIAGRGTTATVLASPRRGRQLLVVIGVAVAAAATTAAVIYLLFWPAAPPTRSARFAIEPPASMIPRSRVTGPGIDIAISPDGSRVVYRVASPASGDSLAVRELGATTSTVIVPTTAGNIHSFSMSRDGRTLAFHAAGKLQTMDFGGTATTVVDMENPPNGTDWISSEELVYASQGKLFRVNASGGVPQLIAEPPAGTDPAATQYLFPEVAPGGQVLFYTSTTGTARRIEARRLSAGDASVIVENASFPKVTASGNLLFVRDGRLMAARFDASSLKIVGETVALEENVGSAKNRGGSSFDVADNGTLVAIAASDVRYLTRFVWRSRRGDVLGHVGPTGMEAPRYPRLSHDDRRLAATVGGGARGQIWVFDLVGAAQPQKLTFDGHHVYPMWTTDDRHLVFWSDLPNSEGRVLNTLPSDGSTLTPKALGKMGPSTVGDLSPDGTSVLYSTVTRETEWDLSLFLVGSATSSPWIAERFAEVLPAFSPDGKWVAYMSTQTGSLEIWVRPFPGPGAPTRITADGGREPLWSRDGRELFYQLDDKLMAVSITVAGTTITPGPTRLLFQGGFVPYETNTPRSYDVARDGRFLMIELPESSTMAGDRGRVSVVLGFDQLVRQRLK